MQLRCSAFRRFILIVLVLSILLNFSFVPCSAASVDARSGVTYLDGWYWATFGLMESQLHWVKNNWSLAFTVGGYTLDELHEMYDELNPYMCHGNTSESGRDDPNGDMHWFGDYVGVDIREAQCVKCGLSWMEICEACEQLYRGEIVSDLIGGRWSVPFHLDSEQAARWDTMVADGSILTYSLSENSLEYTIGKYVRYGSNANPIYYFAPNNFRADDLYKPTWHTWYSDEFYIPSDGKYQVTYGDVYVPCNYCGFAIQRFVNGEWFTVSSTAISPALYEDGALDVYRSPSRSFVYDLVGGYTYRLSIFFNRYDLTSKQSGFYTGVRGYVRTSNATIVGTDASATVYDPETATDEEKETLTEDTRLAALMEYFDSYNKANDYQQNDELANFFLGLYDSQGDLYGYTSPAIFSERTQIFTEPVTGAQYACIKWTYDYALRSYALALEPGTFTIDGEDITYIVLTYGDEGVTIVYLDKDRNQIAFDEYAYVMVANNDCAFHGHTNTVETTKAPTCTGVGERVYTCTVCGNQEIEQIPMEQHVYTVTPVKEPTCTKTGLTVYNCSVCGSQHTETVDALGHDWNPTEVVETTYTLPPETSCPDCSGMDFAADLDKLNGVYGCTCNSCGSSWTVNADIVYGYTRYTCLRCGEEKVENADGSDDGLFLSIGNFIADGIKWCTDKLTQLVESFTSMIAAFNAYLDEIGTSISLFAGPGGGDDSGGGGRVDRVYPIGEFPMLVGSLLDCVPKQAVSLMWLAMLALLLVLVWKNWNH